MVDVYSKRKRSEVMKKITSKNTTPELKVRKSLHARGLRYRLHVKELPGCPDIVLPKYNAVVQVRGCFWHQHICKDGKVPKSNKRYWVPKLEKNKMRDKINDRELRKLGWKLWIVWECEIKNKKLLEKNTKILFEEITSCR